MLQVLAEKFHRCVRALVLPVVVSAAIFAAPTGAFAAEAEANWQLIDAAIAGDTAEVERLLAGGANVNYQASLFDDATALYFASWNGYGAMVDALLARGAAINMQTTTGGETALHAASDQGHSAIVKALLAKRAAINVQMQNGATALYIA